MKKEMLVLIFSIALIIGMVAPAASAHDSKDSGKDTGDEARKAPDKKTEDLKRPASGKEERLRTDAGKESKMPVKPRLDEQKETDKLNAKQAGNARKVIKATEKFKVREMAAERLKEKKDAFETHRATEARLREEYKAKISKLKEEKDRASRCKNQTGGNCKEALDSAIAHAKESALKLADKLIAHLEKLKSKLEGSENLPEQEAAEKAVRLNELISEITALKEKISAATTKEELNAAARELKSLVSKAKRKSEAHSQGLLRAEITGVVHRTEIIQKKLDCAVDSLKASGADTTAVDAKLQTFTATMTSAKDKLKQARELLATEDEAGIAQGKALIMEAKNPVKEAHSLLEEIRQDVRALGGQPCEEAQEIELEDA